MKCQCNWLLSCNATEFSGSDDIKVDVRVCVVRGSLQKLSTAMDGKFS